MTPIETSNTSFIQWTRYPPPEAPHSTRSAHTSLSTWPATCALDRTSFDYLPPMATRKYKYLVRDMQRIHRARSKSVCIWGGRILLSALVALRPAALITTVASVASAGSAFPVILFGARYSLHDPAWPLLYDCTVRNSTWQLVRSSGLASLYVGHLDTFPDSWRDSCTVRI